MAEYFDWHARNSLEDYVNLAVAAQEQGLPVKWVSRWTTTRSDDEVAELLAHTL